MNGSAAQAAPKKNLHFHKRSLNIPTQVDVQYVFVVLNVTGKSTAQSSVMESAVFLFAQTVCQPNSSAKFKMVPGRNPTKKEK